MLLSGVALPIISLVRHARDTVVGQIWEGPEVLRDMQARAMRVSAQGFCNKQLLEQALPLKATGIL